MDMKGKIKQLKAAAFTIECLAHLQGHEDDLLPQAEALREIAKDFEAELAFVEYLGGRDD